MIQVECPKCDKDYELDERRLPTNGLVMRCPECENRFRVMADGSTREAGQPGQNPAGKGSEPVVDVPRAATPLRAKKKSNADLPQVKGADTPELPKRASEGRDLGKRKTDVLPQQSSADEVDLPQRASEGRGLGKRKTDVLLQQTSADDPFKLKGDDAPELPKRASEGRGLGKRKTDVLPQQSSADEVDLPQRASEGRGLGKRKTDVLPQQSSADEVDLPQRASEGRGLGKRKTDVLPQQSSADDPFKLKGDDAPELPKRASEGRGLGKRKTDVLPQQSSDEEPLGLDEEVVDLPVPSQTPSEKLSEPTAESVSLPQDEELFTLDSPAFEPVDLAEEVPEFEVEGDVASTQEATEDLVLDDDELALDADLGIDLDVPASQSVSEPGIDLASETPSAALDLEEADAGMELDLDLPASEESIPGDDDLDLEQPLGELSLEDDDLDLPGEGEAYGEVDLGDVESSEVDLGDVEGGEVDLGDVEGDALEFDALPESRDTESETPSATAEKVEKVVKIPRPKRAHLIPIIITGISLLLFVTAGFSLKNTKYGLFGQYVWERFLPSAGDEAEVNKVIEQAESLLKSDLYKDAEQAISGLSNLGKRVTVNRLLLSRSLLLESMVQVRFGKDNDADLRVRKIASRLSERGNDAPGIHLALAANALRLGQRGVAKNELKNARRESVADPFYGLVLGELALQDQQGENALVGFQNAKKKKVGAAALWGLVRAHALLGEKKEYEAVLTELLEESPDHIEGRMERARNFVADEELDAAYEILKGPAGLEEGGSEQRLTKETRANLFSLIGHIEELRRKPGAAQKAYEQAVESNPTSPAANVGIGRILLTQGNMRDALTRFQALLNVEIEDDAPGIVASGEKSWELQAKLGATQALLAMDRAEEAYEILEDLDKKHPKDPDVMLWFARTTAAVGDDEAAVSYFKRSLKAAPKQMKYYIAFSQYYFDREETKKAFKVLDRAAKKVKMTGEVRRLRGDAELRRNRFDAAIREYTHALEKQPDHPSAYFGMAVAYRRSGKLEEAREALREVRRIDKDYPGLNLERGKLAEAQGRLKDAIKRYRKVVKKDPDAWQIKSRLGAALVETGDYEKAEKYLDEVLEAQPHYPEAEHYLGRIALARGKYEQGRARFARAARIEPHDGVHRVYIAWAALESNQLGIAAKELESALKKDPSLGDAYWLRARLALRAGAVKDALKDVKRALELNPQRYEAYAVIGAGFAQLDRPQEAIAAYTTALEHLPKRADWWYALGRIYFDAAKFKQAKTPIETSIKLTRKRRDRKGWYANAHRLLAEIHREAGEKESAIKHYRVYLKERPETEVGHQEVKDRLRALGVELD